jgi:DNA polymerase III delta subunit
LSDNIRDGMDLSSAMRKSGVWQNREALVRACISRHQAVGFYPLLQLARRGDAAAKGQMRADPWQVATQIVMELAGASVRAA